MTYYEPDASAQLNVFLVWCWLLLVPTWIVLVSVLATSVFLTLVISISAIARRNARRARVALLALAIVMMQCLILGVIVRAVLLSIDLTELEKALAELGLEFRGIPTLGYTFWTLLTAVGLIFLMSIVVIARRQLFWWFRRGNTAIVNGPRLIFNSFIVWLVIVLGISGYILALWFVWLVRAGADATETINLTVALRQAAAIPLATLPFIATYFSRQWLAILHIVRDLIDNEFRVNRGIRGFVARLVGSDEQTKVRRSQIRARLEAVLQQLAKEGHSTIIFIAHSQGSVVLYDYLRESLQRSPRPDCHVITLGSPLSHIYEHYFDEYEDVPAQLEQMRHTISSWTNIFRVDDPIGTSIGPVGNGFVTNMAMSPGGHTGFWSEPKLGQVLLSKLLAGGS